MHLKLSLEKQKLPEGYKRQTQCLADLRNRTLGIEVQDAVQLPGGTVAPSRIRVPLRAKSIWMQEDLISQDHPACPT